MNTRLLQFILGSAGCLNNSHFSIVHPLDFSHQYLELARQTIAIGLSDAIELIGVIYKLWFSNSITGRASVPFEEIISGVSRKNPSKYIPATHSANFKKILLMGLLMFYINAINQARGYLSLSQSPDNREALASRTFMLLRPSVLTQAGRPYEFFRPHTCVGAAPN